MAGFSPKDAALEGFRLTREHPGAVVGLALLHMVLFAVLAGLAVRSGALIDLASLGISPPPTPQQMQPAMDRLISAVAAAAPLMLIIGVIVETAVVRMVLTPALHSTRALQLGMDELRVFIVRVVIAILQTLLQAVGTALMTALAGAPGLPGLIGLLLLAALIMLSVRFSMAIPMTLATKRISIIKPLALTQGRVLPVLGALAMAFGLSVVVMMLASFVTLAVMTATGGWAALTRSSELTVLAQPGVMVLLVVMGVFQALGNIIQIAPAAYIYRAVTRTETQA